MDETLYSGTGVGGPMEGRTIESRYPGGVLFVSKPTNKAWLYDFYPDQGKFYARPLGFGVFWEEMTVEQRLQVIRETTLSGVDPTRELDFEKARKAAEESDVDVRALPEEAREVV
jgi:hypothetical protein